jgi:hypothetical protein
MNEHTASNGVKITRYTDSLDAVDGDASAAWMAPRVVKALREFFRAEEDERLGRWRWPENPEFVVYPGSLSMREAQVVSEEKGCWGQWSEAEARRDAGRDRLAAAAVAYFDAHPAPVWHGAKPGEAWVVTYTTGPTFDEVALLVADFSAEGRVFADADEKVTLPIIDPQITSARRIYPEGDS